MFVYFLFYYHTKITNTNISYLVSSCFNNESQHLHVLIYIFYIHLLQLQKRRYCITIQHIELKIFTLLLYCPPWRPTTAHPIVVSNLVGQPPILDSGRSHPHFGLGFETGLLRITQLHH